MTKQESNNSQSFINSEIKQKKKSKNTITTRSSQELLKGNDLNIIEEKLINGETLSEAIKPYPFSLMKFYAFLKRNPKLEARILEARKIGVQTLIDKLMTIFTHQEVENPNQILWIREKTNFVKWVASKITDLYSDNKTIKQNIDTRMTVSWQSEPDLVDVNATEVVDTKDPLQE
jgi:hypothetical protein